MPKISVIMLTYNRERYLNRAVNSVLTQTFSDFELILIDNGSTDGSSQICDEFQEKDSRVKVLHLSKVNIGTARNEGLSLAKGEYIAFVDDDDIADADFLETLYTAVVTHSADVSICSAYIEEKEKKSLYGVLEKELVMNPVEALINLMWRKLYNNGFPTKLISKKLFVENRFLESGKYEDIHLMYKILANANKVIACGVPKYHVVRHSSNHSNITRKDSLITAEYLEEYKKVYKARTAYLCKRFPAYSENWNYFNWSFQISMINKIITNQLVHCEEHLMEMKKELYKNKERFLKNAYILDFEKEWMKKYIENENFMN